MVDITFMREVFYVTLAFLFIMGVMVLQTWKKIKRESNRVSEYALNINAVIDETIPGLLESMCVETFNDYIILNTELFGLTYINGEMERKMDYEVIELVNKRISPALLDKLCLYYNPKYIDELIVRKVTMIVTAHVVQTNSEKKTKEEL